ncbi:helix-turn-helix transcriptional regulator [Kitasatospora nipponensis]|uniref:helix-turn-helix transcriptional regulator n=1 Tax=Kitasatospora nipponensis TaxID=258049 RepID=UPI0031CF6DC5
MTELLAGLAEQMERWQAELAQAQATVKSLTDQCASHRAEQQGPVLDAPVRESAAPAVLPREEAVQFVVDSLARGARRVSHVRSPDSPFLECLRARQEHWPDPRLSVQELISRPTRTHRTSPEHSRRSVRTTWIRLHEVLIIDDTAALIPSAGGADVTVVQEPAVVQQLAQFFKAAWTQAAHAQEPVVFPDGTVIELKHRIVQLLAEGAKDETVARRLGISLRTCRRHIAEILDQLGASSRFQAGVRAATLGTLPATEGS